MTIYSDKHGCIPVLLGALAATAVVLLAAVALALLWR